MNNNLNNIVIIIAAQQGIAIDEIDKYSVYMCPSGFPYTKTIFWDCEYFTPYIAGKSVISKYIRKIVHRIENIFLNYDSINDLSIDDLHGQNLDVIKKNLFDLLNKLEKNRDDSRLGYEHQIFFLSDKNSSDTLILNNDIRNNKVDKKGSLTAFTQKFTYTTLENLIQAKKTSEIKTIETKTINKIKKNNNIKQYLRQNYKLIEPIG